MKILLLLLSVTCLPLLLAAQSDPPPTAPYLQYGDLYYRNSYSGLSRLMRELPEHDPELHSKLRQKWNQMRLKQGAGPIVGAVGSTTGALIMLGATVNDTGTTTLDRDRRRSRITIGALVLGAGIGGSITLLNRREEVLSFIHTFNAVSEGPKLQFSLTNSAGPGVGLLYWLD